MIAIQKFADKCAIGLSILCAIQCLLTPFILIMAPFLATTLGDEHFHEVMLYIVVPISIVALGTACFKHKKWKILTVGVIGLGIMIFAGVWGHDHLGETYEKVFTLLGAFLLAGAHYKNIKVCHSSNCYANNVATAE